MNTYFPYILFVGLDPSDIMRYTCEVATSKCKKDIHTQKLRRGLDLEPRGESNANGGPGRIEKTVKAGSYPRSSSRLNNQARGKLVNLQKLKCSFLIPRINISDLEVYLI